VIDVRNYAEIPGVFHNINVGPACRQADAKLRFLSYNQVG
jgi:hypothetical protein